MKLNNAQLALDYAFLKEEIEIYFQQFFYFGALSASELLRLVTKKMRTFNDKWGF